MHERSITVQGKDGRWVNLSTVYKGKPVTEAKALGLYESGHIQPLDGKFYKTEPAASNRAAKRSTQSREPGTRQGIRPPGAKR